MEEFGEICCHGKFHSLNEYGSQVLSFVVRATPDRCKMDFFLTYMQINFWLGHKKLEIECYNKVIELLVTD